MSKIGAGLGKPGGQNDEGDVYGDCNDNCNNNVIRVMMKMMMMMMMMMMGTFHSENKKKHNNGVFNNPILF